MSTPITHETTLSVDGMTCMSCIRRVERALSDLDGISAIDVEMRDGTVRVEHDGRPTVEEMVEALGDAGYDSRLAG